MFTLTIRRVCLGACAVGALLVAHGCNGVTGPDGVRLDVTPPDTTVETGTSYKLRIRLYDEDGNELPRATYAAVVSVDSPAIARIAKDDTVLTLSPVHNDWT